MNSWIKLINGKETFELKLQDSEFKSELSTAWELSQLEPMICETNPQIIQKKLQSLYNKKLTINLKIVKKKSLNDKEIIYFNLHNIEK